jgi:HK97 family phage major capsid protein/HK97 family phage prohead protease
MTVRFARAYQDNSDVWTFVASTDAVDRYGDVIEPSGWDLRAFKKNPIALWQHSASQPIGTWRDIQVDEKGRLVATLDMVKAGVSSIADMLRGMVESRVLRAVSVGFLARKIEPILGADGKPTGGLRFLKSELLEISLVSVPANPEALAVARTLGVTEDQMGVLFAKTGDEAPASRLRRYLGQSAPLPPTSNAEGNKRMSLADRIAAKQAEQLQLKDQLTALSVKEDRTEEDEVASDELALQIEALDKSIASLTRAQSALALGSRPAGSGGDTSRDAPQKPALAKARGRSGLLFKAATVLLRARAEGRSQDAVMRDLYSGAADVEAIVRAVSSPATTTQQGWAAELVGETVGDFIDILRPGSVFFNAPIPSFTFGRNKLRLPSRSGGSLAGDFVGEGAPIPVKQLTLTSVVLEPYKLGVISTFTRELANNSTPAIEALLREIMVADTRDTIDTLFLDANAAVPGVRPAGLQNLATGNTAASAGTSLANIITDLKTAIAAMTAANMGKNLVWIMNKQRAMSLQLVTNAAGSFLFRDDLANGTLLGIPLITSTSVPSSVIFLVDAAEMGTAYDDAPQMDVSEQATLHMESDVAKVAPIVAAATGGTAALTDVANPVRSLFQTASMGVRLLWDMTWVQRRAKAVFTVTGVAW